MAMTADSSSNHHSPRATGFSGGGGDGLSSPQFRRKDLPSPRDQVVRGEPESVSSAAHRSPSSSPPPPPPPTSSLPEPAAANSSSPSKAVSASSSPPPVDNSSVVATDSSDATNGNAARPRKAAWNKPSNGVVEVGPVMGAVSWPALSESTKPLPKSPSLADSSSASKVVTDVSVANNQVPVVSHVPQKQSMANANRNSNQNRTMPARQRPKHGGGMGNAGVGPGQSGFTRPSQLPLPSPPPFPVFSVPPNSFGNLVPALPDPSPREPLYRGNNWETRPVGGFVPQSHPASEHRNSSRRGNYGPRGDGQYHNNFGGRRDVDRGNYANARDVHVQPQRGPPRGFVRPPPPNPATFVPQHQPVRPFSNPMGFPEFIYFPQMPMEPYRGMPGVPYIPSGPPGTVFVPVPPEHPLSVMLLNQIDYYFSDANLIKDEYLKSNMDDQGWVPITLIAGFPRVKNSTNNIQLILDSLRNSTVVEVQDGKVRRRSEWMKWVPTATRVQVTDPGQPSPGGSSQDMLTTSFQKMAVEEGTVNQGRITIHENRHSEEALGKRHSAQLIGQSQLPNGEGTTEDTNLSEE